MSKVDQTSGVAKSIKVDCIQDFIKNNESFRSNDLDSFREKLKDQAHDLWDVHALGVNCTIGSINSKMFPIAAIIIHNEVNVISVEVSTHDPMLLISNLHSNKTILVGLGYLISNMDAPDLKDLVRFISKDVFVTDFSLEFEPSRERIEIETDSTIMRFCGALIESNDDADIYEIEYTEGNRKLIHDKSTGDVKIELIK